MKIKATVQALCGPRGFFNQSARRWASPSTLWHTNARTRTHGIRGADWWRDALSIALQEKCIWDKWIKRLIIIIIIFFYIFLKMFLLNISPAYISPCIQRPSLSRHCFIKLSMEVTCLLWLTWLETERPLMAFIWRRPCHLSHSCLPDINRCFLDILLMASLKRAARARRKAVDFFLFFFLNVHTLNENELISPSPSRVSTTVMQQQRIGSIFFSHWWLPVACY